MRTRSFVLFTLGATIVAAPVPAFAGATLQYTYAPTAYTLASTCDLTAPLAFVNLILYNTGDAPTHSQTLEAGDDAGVLGGSQSLLPIFPGSSVMLSIPLRRVSPSHGDIPGTHLISVKPNDYRLRALTLTIPATFCAAGSGTGVRERSQPFAATTTNPYVSERSTVTRPIPPPSPVFSQNIGAGSADRLIVNEPGDAGHARVTTVLHVAPPANVRVAAQNQLGGCTVRENPQVEMSCDDAVRQGGLALAWDWQPSSDAPDIDGFEVYRVCEGDSLCAAGETGLGQNVIAFTPLQLLGKRNSCWVVRAYKDARATKGVLLQSPPSEPYCPQ